MKPGGAAWLGSGAVPLKLPPGPCPPLPNPGVGFGTGGCPLPLLLPPPLFPSPLPPPNVLRALIAPPALTTPPDATSPLSAAVCRAPCMIAARTYVALNCGLIVLMSPATPLTNGAAADVPLI